MTSLSKYGVPLPTGPRRIMGQPKPKNKFRVVLYGFGNDPTWGDSGAAICYETNSVDLPTFTIASHELHNFDNITNYSGKMRWGTMNLTLKDTIDNGPLKAVVQQIQKHKDFNRRMAPRLSSSGYKFEMWIQTLSGETSTTGDTLTKAATLIDQVTEFAGLISSGLPFTEVLSSGVPASLLEGTIDTWICTGCIITDVDFGDKDYSDSDFNTIDITIKPDNCINIDQSGKPLIYDPSSFTAGGLIGSILDATGVTGFINDAVSGVVGSVTGAVTDTFKKFF